MASSLFLVATGNLAFWQHLDDVYSWSENLVFFGSIGLVATASTAFMIALISLLVAVVSMVPLSGQYASLFREHKTIRDYVNPGYAFYSSAVLVADVAFADDSTFRQVTVDASVPSSDRERELVMLVIGETARADHVSLNGYARNTNPRLSAMPRVVSYGRMTSCGTSTAISLPGMFSLRTRSEFETALLYVSDHGESLGENGLYLHGMPDALAPDAQTHVAGILWVGESSDIDFEGTLALKDRPISHDSLASALLALFEVDAQFATAVAAQTPMFRLRPDT